MIYGQPAERSAARSVCNLIKLKEVMEYPRGTEHIDVIEEIKVENKCNNSVFD